MALLRMSETAAGGPGTQYPKSLPRFPQCLPAALLKAGILLSACPSDGAAQGVSTLLLSLPPREPGVKILGHP